MVGSEIFWLTDRMLLIPEFSSRTRVDMALVTESAATNKSFLKLRSDLLKDADEPVKTCNGKTKSINV